MTIDLTKVLTFTEAAEKWQLASGNTLRQAALRGRFTKAEVRKSGTVWLTTYDAMLRVFGPLPERASLSILQSRLAVILASQTQREQFLQEAKAAFQAGKYLQITERLGKKEQVLYLITNWQELERWLTVTKHTFSRENMEQ